MTMTAVDQLTKLLNNYSKTYSETFNTFHKTFELGQPVKPKQKMKKNNCKNIQNKGSWNKLK